MTVREDSDTAAASTRLRKAVREIRSVDVNTDSDSVSLANATGDILVIATQLEESSPTKTLKQVAARIKARDEELCIRRQRAINQNSIPTVTMLSFQRDELAWVLNEITILTTSTDETDGKGGTGD